MAAKASLTVAYCVQYLSGVRKGRPPTLKTHLHHTGYPDKQAPNTCTFCNNSKTGVCVCVFCAHGAQPVSMFSVYIKKKVGFFVVYFSNPTKTGVKRTHSRLDLRGRALAPELV